MTTTERLDVRITFDDALPIASAVDEIRTLMATHPVIVVAGATGSGKTTQLPKIALQAGRRRIAHTQPRRIAARTVAERIAEELATTLGDAVGYQVRFTRRAGRETAIKLMTDGILLAEISRDRDLRAYDTIIIDEAHERSLNIDFLLGYLKQLLPRRPDLRVLVTSATIDTARFSAHFADAPVVEVSGRTYPVEMVYAPLAEGEDLTVGIGAAVAQLHALGEGDILVFCSGEREIRDAAEAIAGLTLRDTEIVPLYARLSATEQQRVFQPHSGTRVVLATNVAETSLTVPGIRSVVDPGYARISRYSARTKVQRLPIEEISQASANQRAGRCGRLGPGICIRLYSEDNFNQRPAFTEPEILRTNLASVILQMADARLGDIAEFPFVEPPDQRQVRDGLRLLDELGALAGNTREASSPGVGRAEGVVRGPQVRLTQTGRLLARLPVDPRLGRMLVEAGRRGVLWEVLPVVAGLAIPDVRERPADHQAEADTLHRRFWTASETDGRDPSDIAALWRLWEYLREQRTERSGNGFRRMCRAEFLHFLRIREWQDLVSQLREIVVDVGLDAPAAPSGGRGRRRGRQRRGQPHPLPQTRVPASAPDFDAIHQSVLAGLLSHIGLQDTRPVKGRMNRGGRRPLPEYLGARGARFAIQPGSAAAKAAPSLVMAVELVETSRLWARTVAPIRADWVEEVGAHLVKRHHSEPRWSARQGQSVATEKVTLLGVPIVADRTVSYGRIDPVVAREIFIRAALVEGQWRTRHHFYARNQAVLAEAERVEERNRRRDLVADDEVLFAFYEARVPASVTSVAHFDSWWRTARRADDQFLDLRLDDLVAPTEVADQDSFPDTWTVGPVDLPVSYSFDPGARHDGVTVTIDVSMLNQVTAAPFTWHVPGLRSELVTELIRSLPKAIRTRFVPAPDWGRRALAWLADHPRVEPITVSLAAALGALTGEDVEAAAFNPGVLPEHLRVRYRITDGTRELGAGKDFDALRQEFAPQLNRRLNRAASTSVHPGAATWEFGTLSETTTVERDPTPLVGYPALVDQGATVGVRIADTAEQARRWHPLGLRRLLVLTTPDPTRSVFARLGNPEKIALSSGPYPSLNAALADARLKATGDLMAAAVDPWTVRDPEAFRQLYDQVRAEVANRMQQIAGLAGRILVRHAEATRELAGLTPGASRADIEAQLSDLIFEGFISATEEPHFPRLERYLQAIAVRLAGIHSHPVREAEHLEQLGDLEDAYAAIVQRYPVGALPTEVADLGWMLEELRVSLFAQVLGTAQPVSVKRVRRALAGL
ncbi:MAG: ATP-dependent RNA helicase HrpA [Propioniciclava sp.]